jgi:two-component system, OmpR family, sensor kinase
VIVHPRIRLRLTVWAAGSTLVLLLAAVLAMRSWARRALARQHEEAVAQAVDLVRSFFRAEVAEYRAVDATLAHIASELVFAGMGIDFLRPDGTAFAHARAPRGAPAVAAPVRAVTVPLEPALAPGWSLRLDVSAADLESARERIDRATLVAVPMAVALAALIGWLVTGRALRPVRVMADAADRLAGSGRGGRLPIADPDDELGRMGRLFNTLLDRLDLTIGQQRRFLADAAHELRTPLARMRAEAESQLASPGSGDGDRHALARIRRDLERASALVDELLQLARADAGSALVERRAAFLDDIVSDALGPWYGEARRRAITLEVNTLEEAPALLDERLVSRLADILLDNALRYTREGGAVSVRVGLSGEGAVLEVRDGGIGIAVDEQPHVFERFYRGAGARTLAPEGSGLGLAIAGWIAREHDADITVGPAPAGGTMARVVFPAITPAEAPATVASARS